MTTCKFTTALFATALLGGVLPLQAADFERISSLIASDGGASHFYGHAVAIDGDFAIVGSNEHDHGGNDRSGGAYILQRDAMGNWSERAELIPGDGMDDDLFGFAVGISGNTAVVGATDTDDLAISAGSAYIFVDDGSGNWSLQQELLASDGALENRFGLAVAIAGDTAIVTASKNNSGFSESGAAYVFVRDGAGAWSQQQKLVPSDPSLTAHFGSSVAIDGDVAVIGARDDGENGPQNGAAYVFRRDAGGVWNEESKLLAPAVTTRDHFGASVAISSDTVLVGVSESDLAGPESGSAYVFTRDVNGNWLLQGGVLQASDASAGHKFGESVSLDGNNALIGAFGNNAVYVFTRDTSGTWTEAQRLTRAAGSVGGLFGFSVALSGNRAIVGHKANNNSNGAGAGLADVFEQATPEDLIQDVIALVMSLNLHHGIENALDAKLDAALQALDDANTGNDQAAINSLNSFINQVSAQSGNQIDSSDAATLINAAQEIIDLLNAG